MISRPYISNLNPKMYRMLLYFVVIAFASCNRSVKTDESRVIYKETKDYEVFEMPNELKEISH